SVRAALNRGTLRSMKSRNPPRFSRVTLTTGRYDPESRALALSRNRGSDQRHRQVLIALLQEGFRSNADSVAQLAEESAPFGLILGVELKEERTMLPIKGGCGFAVEKHQQGGEMTGVFATALDDAAQKGIHDSRRMERLHIHQCLGETAIEV